MEVKNEQKEKPQEELPSFFKKKWTPIDYLIHAGLFVNIIVIGLLVYFALFTNQ